MIVKTQLSLRNNYFKKLCFKKVKCVSVVSTCKETNGKYDLVWFDCATLIIDS